MGITSNLGYACKINPIHCDESTPCLKITPEGKLIICNQLKMTIEWEGE